MDSETSRKDYLGNGYTYAYDALNLVMSINDSSRNFIMSYTYDTVDNRLTEHSYDSVGNITSTTDLTGQTTYGYDYLYQLTSATYPGPKGTVSYQYDNAGNRTKLTQNGSSTSWNYDPGNELMGNGTSTFQYDLAGNTIQKKTGNVTQNNTWDALNRLTVVSSGSGAITYVYDGDNHRVQKLTASSTTNYYYDGNSVLAEGDANGNVQVSYNPGVSQVDKQGTKLFYLFNGHGDVTGLMD